MGHAAESMLPIDKLFAAQLLSAGAPRATEAQLCLGWTAVTHLPQSPVLHHRSGPTCPERAWRPSCTLAGGMRTGCQ